MCKINPVKIHGAKGYIENRAPKTGAGLLAHQLLHEKLFRALVPLNITQDQSESLRQGGITGWDDTTPALLQAFNEISSDPKGCFVGVQMLQAKEKDFPEGEDFEVESRPYRFVRDGVVYVSAPLAVTSPDLLQWFIKLDIGFDTIVLLLDRPFRPSWFDLDEHKKKASILAIAYDAYDRESFIYATTECNVS